MSLGKYAFRAFGPALLCVSLAAPAHAATCGSLAGLNLPDTTIESATPVAAGAFAEAPPARRAQLPAFCRVVASVKSAPDSDIRVEVWLPQTGWAGVFHGAGNGGYGGTLRSGYAGMEAGLLRGYATATTDTGTAPATGLDGDALIGHPRKWKDWGLLSTHVMTVTGKAIADAFYGAEARRAYFTGCSTGGQQGLIEAQQYPDDYDGILIGAPVVNRTWGHAAVLWDFLAANRAPGHELSEAKLALLHRAVLTACAGRGAGLPDDPFVADPQACRFDPAVLACSKADAADCLTPAEAETARAFYSGPVNKAGQPLYYGWMPGSEGPNRYGWRFLQSPPNGEPAFGSLFKWVFGPDWDWRGFDLERDMPKVDAVLGPVVNGAAHGDFDRFQARGGKLIIYQGWADTLVAPGQTLDLYRRLERRAGSTSEARRFVRLFMAPGVMHCGGGEGPDAFNSASGGVPPDDTAKYDLFAALADWVEHGMAPEQVIATKYAGDGPGRDVALQRPLCAFPDKAWRTGAGDPRRADSFVCASEPPAATH
jgi:hypothetical protein